MAGESASSPLPAACSDSPVTSYVSIFLTCARACLVRDTTFRANYLLECVTSLGWMSLKLAFYLLVFKFTPEICKGTKARTVNGTSARVCLTRSG